jgi:hypothetical protein
MKVFLNNFHQFIIPLLGILLYLWILYTLHLKERPLPNSSFRAAVRQKRDGQKIGETCRRVKIV